MECIWNISKYDLKINYYNLFMSFYRTVPEENKKGEQDGLKYIFLLICSKKGARTTNY